MRQSLGAHACCLQFLIWRLGFRQVTTTEERRGNHTWPWEWWANSAFFSFLILLLLVTRCQYLLPVGGGVGAGTWGELGKEGGIWSTFGVRPQRAYSHSERSPVLRVRACWVSYSVQSLTVVLCACCPREWPGPSRSQCFWVLRHIPWHWDSQIALFICESRAELRKTRSLKRSILF